MNNKTVGQKGEELAETFLRDQGYRILRRNYRNKMGEIDLVAQESDCICFVEVKSRQTTRFGAPQEAITFAKKRKLYRVALCFLKDVFGHTDKKSRFDVVTVQENAGNQPQIAIIKNAFDLAGFS